MATEIEAIPPSIPLDMGDTAADAPSSPSSAQKKRKGTHANADVPELEVDLSLPEPPSKRAKRALKKGKPLPAKPKSEDERDDDDGAGGKATGKAADGSITKKAERSQFGVWIGNLPFTVTRPHLFQWLVDNSGGAITEADITRVNLPLGKRLPHQQRPNNVHGDSTTSPNKGFAYVDFATYEAQVAASALSETELDGRRVLIKDSKSFEGRPAKEAQAKHDAAAAGENGEDAAETATAPPSGTTSTKVFVGNLGFDTSEDDLRRHFAPCGPVAWVKVATFPDNTEKCRGYGWVQFGGKTDEGQNITPEAASAAAAAAVQGFVRITETVDTEDDFLAEAAAAAGNAEDEEASDSNDATASTSESKPHKSSAARTKTRKWWVNMLKGRPLKIQFAEDDVVRYKKRFKGRPQQQTENQDQGQSQPKRRPRPDRAQDGADKPYKHQDLGIAQRTGAITVSLGKKTILE